MDDHMDTNGLCPSASVIKDVCFGVSSSDRWPRSVLCSRTIQTSVALLQPTGSSVCLCVTQFDSNVIIGGIHFLWRCAGQACSRLIYTTMSCYMRIGSACEKQPFLCSSRHGAELNFWFSPLIFSWAMWNLSLICVCGRYRQAATFFFLLISEFN